MALVSSVIGPLVFLAIRNTIIHSLGIEQAGYWESMNRIATYYFMFVSTILSVYFLPRLAFVTSREATKKVFWSYYKGIVPFFIAGLVLLYFLRVYIVSLLFTKDFLPVTDLFFWQFIGDIFKVLSLILGNQFFAKKLTLAFITTEFMSLTFMYLLSTNLIPLFGIQGVVMAHAINYCIYFTVLCCYFRKSLF
jgi:PST family polysaccharide transporter